jgi:hypothetical protein
MLKQSAAVLALLALVSCMEHPVKAQSFEWVPDAKAQTYRPRRCRTSIRDFRQQQWTEASCNEVALTRSDRMTSPEATVNIHFRTFNQVNSTVIYVIKGYNVGRTTMPVTAVALQDRNMREPVLFENVRPGSSICTVNRNVLSCSAHALIEGVSFGFVNAATLD